MRIGQIRTRESASPHESGRYRTRPTALAVSLSRAESAPYSFFFLAIGAGMLVGTVVVRCVFARSFENVA